MSDPSSLAVQKAMRDRLIAAAGVTALVPARNIIDAHGAPSRFPSINIGESQTVADDLTYARQHVRIYATLHVWTEEGGLETCKRIAGAVRAALRAPLSMAGFVDGQIDEERFLRDPDGKHAHGIITYSVLVEEAIP